LFRKDLRHRDQPQLGKSAVDAHGGIVDADEHEVLGFLSASAAVSEGWWQDIRDELPDKRVHALPEIDAVHDREAVGMLIGFGGKGRYLN
jgi:hypothetical protein